MRITNYDTNTGPKERKFQTRFSESDGKILSRKTDESYIIFQPGQMSTIF